MPWSRYCLNISFMERFSPFPRPWRRPYFRGGSASRQRRMRHFPLMGNADRTQTERPAAGF
jgi:hypothetical protein